MDSPPIPLPDGSLTANDSAEPDGEPSWAGFLVVTPLVSLSQLAADSVEMRQPCPRELSHEELRALRTDSALLFTHVHKQPVRPLAGVCLHADASVSYSCVWPHADSPVVHSRKHGRWYFDTRCRHLVIRFRYHGDPQDSGQLVTMSFILQGNRVLQSTCGRVNLHIIPHASPLWSDLLANFLATNVVENHPTPVASMSDADRRLLAYSLGLSSDSRPGRLLGPLTR